VSRPDVTVTLCRDCCCGSGSKHPGTDHDEQRARLLACASDTVRVRVSDCLDECSRSNVVHVRDHRRPRREADTWLARVLGPRETEALVGWVSDGASAPLPPALRARSFGRRGPA
jgi:hypothetical protein